MRMLAPSQRVQESGACQGHNCCNPQDKFLQKAVDIQEPFTRQHTPTSNCKGPINTVDSWTSNFLKRPFVKSLARENVVERPHQGPSPVCLKAYALFFRPTHLKSQSQRFRPCTTNCTSRARPFAANFTPSVALGCKPRKDKLCEANLQCNVRREATHSSSNCLKSSLVLALLDLLRPKLGQSFGDPLRGGF